MKWLPFAVAVFIIVAMSLYARLGVTWYTHDIVGVALPAGCELFSFGTETQSEICVCVQFSPFTTDKDTGVG